jgi:hypothetical protein
MKAKNNNRKNLFHALALGAFIVGNVASCISSSAMPEAKEPKREPLECRLDEERSSQNYTLELEKGDLSLGINPVRYNDGKAGYIMNIRDKRGENEYIDTMLEVYEDKIKIYDKTLGKNRMTGSNCYAEEIKIKAEDFYARFNKSCRLINNKKVDSEWTHVYGDVCGKEVTVIDRDGDKKPDSVSFDDNLIEINQGRKISGFNKLPAEKNKEIIDESTKLFDRAQEYFSENVGSFGRIKF